MNPDRSTADLLTGGQRARVRRRFSRGPPRRQNRRICCSFKPPSTLDGKLHMHRMEKRYLRKDGSIVWVGLTCLPLWDAPGTDLQHIAMVEDITDRKQAEDRLAESERKYRMLVEHANSIILRWNSEGRIIFLNEFGQRFFGYSEEEILGPDVSIAQKGAFTKKNGSQGLAADLLLAFRNVQA